MNRARRYDNTLPWLESQRALLGQINLKAPLHDQKEFVGMWVPVPRVIPAVHRKPKTARIHSTEHLVPVPLGYGSCLSANINDRKQRVASWLARI